MPIRATLPAVESRFANVACHCGGHDFQVRIDKNEQVGLTTCAAGHHSFLLDSRDHWADVIQDGRPPIVRCRCKANRFAVSLEYHLRPEGDVSQVDVVLRCSSCAASKRATTFEIDYSPTDSLLSSPLEPCPNPWLVARRHSYTAFWKPADFEQALRLVGLEAGHAWFAGWQETPRMVEMDHACELALEALASQKSYNVLFSNTDLDLSDTEPRDCWKSLPVIQFKAPISMNYRIEAQFVQALLHYIEFAEEVSFRGAIVSQPVEFNQFATRAVRRLRSVFVSDRGPRTLDAPGEFARVAPALGVSR